jgi:hypothetical protein
VPHQALIGQPPILLLPRQPSTSSFPPLAVGSLMRSDDWPLRLGPVIKCIASFALFFDIAWAWYRPRSLSAEHGRRIASCGDSAFDVLSLGAYQITFMPLRLAWPSLPTMM